MPIHNIQTGQVGLVSVLPSIAYIQTNDPVATIEATGYLNKAVAHGEQFSLPCMALVSTQESPTSVVVVGWYQVRHSGVNWSLVAA